MAFPLGLAALALLREWMCRDRARTWAEIAGGKRAPRPGLTVVHGVVDADGEGPAVTVLLVMRAKHWSYHGSPRTDWIEATREVHARPFHVRQPNGVRIHVDPGERVMLIDQLEPGDDEPERRTLVARLQPGEPVHLLGVLDQAPDPEAGGYRDPAVAPIIRPPRRGRMLISTEPLDARATREADYWRSMRKTALWLSALPHLFLVQFYYQALRGALGHFGVDGHNLTLFGFGLVMTVQFTLGLLFLFMRDIPWWERPFKYTGGYHDDPFRKRHTT